MYHFQSIEFFSSIVNSSAPRRCMLLSGVLERVDGHDFKFLLSGSFHFASECGMDPLYRLVVTTDVPCPGHGGNRCYGASIE